MSSCGVAKAVGGCQGRWWTMTDQRIAVGDEDLRDRAIVRLKKKSDFGAHLLVYLLVNACLAETTAALKSAIRGLSLFSARRARSALAIAALARWIST